jgi:hypothetical protein
MYHGGDTVAEVTPDKVQCTGFQVDGFGVGPVVDTVTADVTRMSEAKLLITAKAMSPTLIGCGCDTSHSKAG